MAEAVKAIQQKLGKQDPYILGIYITLIVVSVVESFSASSREVTLSSGFFTPMAKQLMFLALGIAAMVICSKLNYAKFVTFGIGFSVITVGFMLFAAFFGKNINGAQRAVHFGIITVQPAELAKVAIVFLLSLVMATNMDRKANRIKDKGMWVSVGIVGLFGFILAMQGMTNALLFGLVSLAMIVIGNINWKKFGIAALSIGFILLCIYAFSNHAEDKALPDLEQQTEQTADNKPTAPRSGTWGARLDRYFERFRTPLYTQPITEKNDQEMYSYMAQAHGGVVGVIPGNSRECSRLPLAFSDYVFSIIVEETGLIGGLFLIGLFFTLLIRAGNIARKCNRAYPAFLVMGMAVMVVLQAYFHMAINTGVFPVSGQPLPMISKGGTSVIVTSIAFGVMLSVSRTATQTNVARDVRREEERLPESMRAANPTRNE